MIVLGIDSSTTVATVAVATEEKVLGEYSIDDRNTHSQKLMVMVESLLDQLDMDIDDVDCFAISKGPGSFTGLRIGLATVKSFAYALDKKMVGLSSLLVIANNHKYFEGTVVPMMDARNKRVFTAVYRANDGELYEVVKEDAMELEALFSELESAEGRIMFAGDGSRAYRDEIETQFGERAIFSDGHLNTPRASSLCMLAFGKCESEEFEDYFTMKPEYLRDSQAEQQRKSKSGRQNG